MLNLFLPRQTRSALRAFSHGIEQSLRSARSTIRPVFTALHTEEKLAGFAEQARAGESGDRSLPWRLSIVDIERSANGVVIWLERPTTLEFAAGQFLTISVRINGQEYRRQYSIFTDPEDRQKLGLGIRRVKGGLVSNHITDTAAKGGILSADGPSGRFTLPASQGPVVLIAGGVGVTPLLSIAAEASRAGRDVLLVCANRGVRSIMLRSELDALADVGAVEVRHVLERPTNSLLAAKGRITPSLVFEIATPRPGADYFVCGPEPMMNLVCTALAQASVPEEQIHTERFIVAKRENDTTVDEGRTHAVRFSRSGRLVNIQEGQTILEGARAAGLQLPFSCTMGGCAACKLRVEGKVHLPDPNCLTATEAAAGETLACIACPRSSLTIDA